MIRLGSHTPLSVRLHIRAQLAAAATSRKVQSLRQEATAIFTNSLSVLQRTPRRPARLWQPRHDARPPAGHAGLLREFKARYENLIDLLCSAAQDLAEPGDADRYAQIRAWFVANYHFVRPALSAYLDATAAPAAADPFEALFLPATLEQAIHSDELLPHVLETRRVVDAIE